jgi:PAS domain-containing protein
MNRNKPTYEELEKKISDLNAENAKLAQSVFLFQSIFEKLPFGLQIFDKEGFSFKMNQALKKLLGLPNLNEGIGKFNVLTDKFTATNSKNKVYERVFKGEEFTHDIEYDFGGPDNEWNTRKDKVYFNETIFPVLNSKNKLECDLYYIKNMSLFLDFKILLRTIGVVLLGDGAR